MNNGKEYDTLVSVAVKRDPLAFVDILREEAEAIKSKVADEHVSGGYALLLLEASCVIANLLLTDEKWHENIKKE